MINKQRIGEYLKNLRKSKGYTQEGSFFKNE